MKRKNHVSTLSKEYFTLLRLYMETPVNERNKYSERLQYLRSKLKKLGITYVLN